MKSAKILFLVIALISMSNLFAHEWEFQFRIFNVVNGDTVFQQVPIIIYRHDVYSNHYSPLGQGYSFTNQLWNGAYNAIVNIQGVSDNHPEAIMTLDSLHTYIVRVGNKFKKIVNIGEFDESFYFNTSTQIFTTDGNYSVTAEGDWNEKSILVRNNFAGGNMYINDYLEESILYTGRTLYREASTFPHTLTAINNQEAGGYKRSWYQWSDTYPYLNRQLNSAQNFYESANFKEVYKIYFKNNFGNEGSGGIINVNSFQYNSPTSFFEVVDGGSINSSVPNQTINGIDFTFKQWDDANSSNPRYFYPADHDTFTVYYIGKPNTNGRSQSISTNGNNDIIISWSEHPSTSVTQYKIYRRVGKTNPTISLIGTVSRGTLSFTDPDYTNTGDMDDDWLSYDARPYYSPDGTESDPNFQGTVWGLILEKYNESIKQKDKGIPTEYAISNFPNPFNPTTTINYQLPQDGVVTIKIYDVLGKEVATLVDEHKNAGYYRIDFNGTSLSSGVYLATIQTNNFSKSIKLLLTK